ncbi:MAG: insulinase family protein [Clostridiales bacterium]|jgi:predicted Zn-dependent peptidase|nr:insulinase family protein [Clostridiales bacterium]
MHHFFELENGVTVVTEKIDFVRSVALGVWIKTGSRDESAETNGISHFVEHMLFKGTQTRTARQIAEEMDAIGGQLNAYTSKELTCYYALCLDSHFDIALDVLADMFFRSAFDEDEIIKERSVILEEISMYEDTPEDLAYDFLQRNIWNGGSLGFPTLGEERAIMTFSRDTFISYVKERYRPENIVLSIAGHFDEQLIVEKLARYFSAKADAGVKAADPEPSVYTPRIVKKRKDIEQIHMAFGFPGIPVGSDKAHAMALLNSMVGSGMSSRLFQSIRETYGLVYSIYSYNSSFRDVGIFNIYAGLNPLNAERAIDLIMKELKNLYDDKITEEQLSKAKEQLKSGYVLSLESSVSRMNAIGKAKVMTGRVLTADEVLSKINKVSVDDVYGLIDQTFDFDKVCFAAVGPVEGIDFSRVIKNAVI